MAKARRLSHAGAPRVGGRSDPTMDRLVLALIVTMFLPQGVVVPVGNLDVTPFQMVAATLMCLIVMERRVRWTWVDLMVPAYLGVQITSWASSSGLTRAVEAGGRVFLDCAGPYLVGRYVASEDARFWQASRWLVTGLVLLVPLLVVEALFSVNVHNMIWGLLFDVASVHREERFGLRRAMGWAAHPIMLGLTYASMFPLVAFAALRGRRELGSGIGFKTAAIVLGVILSLSSGPWLTIAIMCGFLAIDMWSVVPSLKWKVVFIGAPLTWVILENLTGRPLLRILMMHLHISSPMGWYYRWKLYERVLGQMPGHWWLGYGMNLPAEFTGKINWSIDNQYLVVLLMTGLSGLVTWLGLMAWVSFDRYRAVWSGPSKGLASLTRSVRFTVLSIAAAQLTVALFSTANMMLFWVMGTAVTLGMRCSERSGRGSVTRVVTPGGRARRAPHRAGRVVPAGR